MKVFENVQNLKEPTGAIFLLMAIVFLNGYFPRCRSGRINHNWQRRIRNWGSSSQRIPGLHFGDEFWTAIKNLATTTPEKARRCVT